MLKCSLLAVIQLPLIDFVEPSRLSDTDIVRCSRNLRQSCLPILDSENATQKADSMNVDDRPDDVAVIAHHEHQLAVAERARAASRRVLTIKRARETMREDFH